MQSDHKEIYKLTAERTGKDQQIYKDLGNMVFATLYSNLRRPKSLIIKLQGVGTWYLRRMRMQAMLELFPPDYSKTREDFSSPYAFIDHENKIEIFEILRNRLKEYEEYIQLKREIAKKRRETQVLLEPKDDEC